MTDGFWSGNQHSLHESAHEAVVCYGAQCDVLFQFGAGGQRFDLTFSWPDGRSARVAQRMAR